VLDWHEWAHMLSHVEPASEQVPPLARIMGKFYFYRWHSYSETLDPTALSNHWQNVYVGV